MATVINLKVKSDFKGAADDLKSFGAVSEESRKKFEKFEKVKSDNIQKFTERTNRATAAVRATRGPMAALEKEYKDLQRQIETLIRRGLDPQDEALKPLIKRYQKLEKEIKDTGNASKKTQKQMFTMEGALKALGAGAVIAGAALTRAFIDFSRESAQAASDAEEIEGKFNVVFGNISDDANAAASTIADEFDLAASTVNKLLGDTGDILTGLGFDQKTALDLSEQVGTLALDLASFTNFAGGAEGASAALTKALLGEAESVKALGIVIRQDTVEYKELVSSIMEVNGVGLVQAKALAALQIATEQSKNAIGDYQRTIESTANVTRRLEETQKSLKEAFGVALNEGLTPFRSVLAEINIELADAITSGTSVNNVLKNLRGDGDLSAASVESLTETLARLNAERAAGSALGFNKNLDEEISLLEQQIALKERADAGRARGTEEAKRAAEVAEAEAKALEEQNKWTLMRIDAQSALEAKLDSINQKEALSIKLGQDYNAEQERSKAVVSTLNSLLEKGFTVEGAGISRILSQYEEYLTTKENIVETESEHEAFIKKITAAYEDQAETQRILAEQKAIIDAEQEEKDNAQIARIEMIKAAYIDMATSIPGQVAAVAGAIKSLIDSQTDATLRALDAEAAARIEAGEDDVKVTAEIEKRKAEIEYKAALSSWKLQLTQSIASGAQAVLSGLLTQPFIPAGLAAGALAGTLAGLQIAAVAKAKPVKQFQTGTNIVPFTVPSNPATSAADSQQIAVSPGETVQVSPRGEGGMTQNISVAIDAQVLFDVVNDGIESGDVRITADNIQAAS